MTHDELLALGKKLKTKVKHLLALTEGHDPYYCGTPAQVALAEWFAGIWDGYHMTSAVHTRRIHYWLVSQEEDYSLRRCLDGSPYENTIECWRALSIGSKYARTLKLVDPTDLVDRRNNTPTLYAEPRYHKYPGAWVGGRGWQLPYIFADLSCDVGFELPRAHVGGYDYGLGDQPYLIEIWTEKSGDDDVLLPLCEKYGVNLVHSTRFQSITAAVNLLDRAKTLRKPARIFYLSDFDPAGDSMPKAVSRQVEFWREHGSEWHDVDICLKPLVLTREQVQQYQLPPIPIKKSDRRAAGFYEKYGVSGATEIDAMQAKAPGALRKIVEDAILGFIDQTFERRLSSADAQAQRIVRREWRDATDGMDQTLADIRADAEAIAAKYQQRLDDLKADMDTELAPVQERLDALGAELDETKSDFAPDLPPRPKPEVDADVDDWLYRSGRDYLDQIAYYKRVQSEEED